MANYQREPQVLPLPENSGYQVLLNNYSSIKETPEGLALEGYQAVVLELEK